MNQTECIGVRVARIISKMPEVSPVDAMKDTERISNHLVRSRYYPRNREQQGNHDAYVTQLVYLNALQGKYDRYRDEFKAYSLRGEK